MPRQAVNGRAAQKPSDGGCYYAIMLHQAMITRSAGAAASWLLFAVVAFAPLPFGSNEPSAIAFWCIALGICLVMIPVPQLRTGEFLLVALAAAVVAAYGFVLHEQLSDAPWLATPDPIWKEASDALGVGLTPSAAIAHGQPFLDLGRPLVCMLAMACGFLVGRDGDRARQLMKVIAWSGVAYACYGVMSHLFDPTHILAVPKEAYLDSVTATFINHNTAATYFGSCAVVWSVLLWDRMRRATPHRPIRWREMLAEVLTVRPPRIVVAFAMLMLCVLTMFMTGSRAGVILSLLALVMAFVMFFRRDLPPRIGLISALSGAGFAAVLVLQLLGGTVNSRFDAQGLADEGRLETYRSTLHLIADHPWFGTGEGTFVLAFPSYRSPNVSVWWTWDLAHNTLLQLAADMGVPIAAIVVGAWCVVFAVLFRGALIRRSGLSCPVAALAVAALAVLHSMVDFSLQIPGYAIVALSLVGAGLAQSFPARQPRGILPLPQGDEPGAKTGFRLESPPAERTDILRQAISNL
jgi:O-antigen ligase